MDLPKGRDYVTQISGFRLVGQSSCRCGKLVLFEVVWTWLVSVMVISLVVIVTIVMVVAVVRIVSVVVSVVTISRPISSE